MKSTSLATFQLLEADSVPHFEDVYLLVQCSTCSLDMTPFLQPAIFTA